MTEVSDSRVLLLGWDGADWKIVHQLLNKGQMPALESLIRQGVMGNISTLKPSLSPILWSTIATGKSAEKHNILGFTEPSPDGSGVRPVSSESWGCKPLWRIISQQGQKTAVVNWFATHPADVIEGTVVSDSFRSAHRKDSDNWPVPPRAISPESLVDVMGDLRVHREDLEPSQMSSLIPEARITRRKPGKRLTTMARLHAECATVHATGTYLAKHQSWNLLAVYYDTLDRICHDFMRYRAPKMPYVSEKDFVIYGRVVDNWYRFFDGLLSEYLSLVDEKTTILLISDHGFHSDHLRPVGTQHSGFRNPVHWHREYGILVCRGPSIKTNELVFGASLLDIAPTVLHLLGLPVARDMEGRVLTGVYEKPAEPVFIDTYETESKPLSPSTPTVVSDPHAVCEALEQLADLGYIDPVPEDAAEAIEKVTFSNQLTLAEVHFQAGRSKEAALILEGLVSANRKRKEVKLRLAECYLRMGRIGECCKILEEILSQDPDGPQVHVIYGDVLLSEEQFESALAHYKRAEEMGPNLPKVTNKMGSLYLKQKRWRDAERLFKKALDIDGDNAEACRGLGVAQHHQGQHELAVDNLLHSIGLQYYQPFVHFQLGVAFSATDRIDEAIDSVLRALELAPDLAPARNLLTRLYRIKGETGQAALHKVGAKGMEKKRQEKMKCVKSPATGRDRTVITIVTGLPRSGTSMMMQMLQASGLGVLTDGIRRADEDNPKGYFEFEQVKTIKRDVSWLKEAEGKAVKLVCPLLYDLPANRKYQIVFMERDMDEILASQLKMLSRSGKTVEGRKNENLKRVFEREVAKLKSWLERQQGFRFLCVPYKDVVDKPFEWAHRVHEFLGGNLNIQSMALVVERELYRQRR
ncbi:MAG TPA: tetratricopeptide repeat protein [Desulfobacterales bacterium]|nr:tetratricopeptide repeat protein [Desulfobacterales bacterium]